ncbi:MAG: hypothetical protein KatS3mg026_0627 [Bacteroidia bacterium]|nr:MAG: hypothetical protein KatS3mg026_0627 [Bacteroidia bacterium]
MSVAKPLTAQDVYVSAAFEPASLSIYQVGVYAESQNLLYGISTVQNEPLLVRLYKNRDGVDWVSFLETIWHQDEFLRKRFSQGQLLLDVDRWLVVPAEYVPDGQEADYLRAYYEIQSEEGKQAYLYKKEVLRGTGAAFLYLLPRPLGEYLEARASTYRVLHKVTRTVQLTMHLVRQAGLAQRDFFGAVWLFLGGFYYVLLQGEQLVFVNHFQAATAEDVLYYVQALHSLLGIDKSQVNVVVGGYSGLRPYVATVFYRFFGAGYRDLGRLFPAPPTLKEAGLAVEDLLPLLFVGADSAG